jgi:hypothetical protein
MAGVLGDAIPPFLYYISIIICLEAYNYFAERISATEEYDGDSFTTFDIP